MHNIIREEQMLVDNWDACSSACWYEGLGEGCYAYIYEPGGCYLLNPAADISGSGLGSALVGLTVKVYTKEGSHDSGNGGNLL
jgi:hypothetical protein